MNLWETINTFAQGKSINLIDIGGYKGEFTDNCTKNIENINHVDIYEPHDKSFVELEKKYLNNNTIQVLNIAIGENKKDEIFYFDDKEGYNSSLLKPIFNDFKTKKTFIDTLDNLYNFEHNNSFILKTDTQGNDLNVLRGG